MSKPITVHGHGGGPNPWKVVILLEELKVPYEIKWWTFPQMKTPEYEKINPNGRSPTIEDPNTGITLWESGAILEYLEENYDKSGTFTIKSTPEKYYIQQWLHYQMSGQGPYFGQRVWFTQYHPEKVQSAIDRYGDEIKRVIGVIERHLKQTGTEYLVGNKVTYADLAFIPWFNMVPFAMGDNDIEKSLEKDYPAYYAWYQKLRARPAVTKTLEMREKAMKDGH